MAAPTSLVFFMVTQMMWNDVLDYVILDAEGYDGFGTVVAAVDWNKLEKDLGKQIKLSSEGKKEIEGNSDGSDEERTPIGASQKIDFLRDFVTLKTNGGKGLSNGDELSYTWDKKNEEQYDCYKSGSIAC